MRRQRKLTDRRHETVNRTRTGRERTGLATDAGIAPIGQTVGSAPIVHIVPTCAPIVHIVPT